MKRFIRVVAKILKDFFINPFWRSWQVLLTVIIALAINGFIWYFYLTRIKENPTPFIFSSGLILSNLLLANYLWNREKLMATFLLIIALFTQILMLVFIRSFIFLSI